MPTITYNIPAGIAADMLAALRKHYNMPGATAAQIEARVETELKNDLKKVYSDYMRSKSYDVSLD